MLCRSATHAHSWYSGKPDVLDSQLNSWLEAVGTEIESVGRLPVEGARIIIAPHAGYSYSGPAAAWAYKCFDVSKTKRVFVLGPSHHVYLDGCALSSCDSYEATLGNLAIDKDAVKELHATGKFSYMDVQTDEDEHSIEMHLPYVYKVLKLANKISDTKIVPIMVGAINARKEKEFGAVLAPWLKDPENVFVISSDFCHWGLRFSYTNYYPALPTPGSTPQLQILTSRSNRPLYPEIHESIEALDEEGMEAIETTSHDKFVDYLRRTKNTICGRHPIGVIMAGIEIVLDDKDYNGKGKFKFVRYEQSSECREVTDSSVSYASAFAVL